jgi:IclR family acetate operon transcriptional repressor
VRVKKTVGTQMKSDAVEKEREGAGGALARGLAVLDVVLAAPQPLTLSEIAGQAQLDQSTTMRLLRSLEESKYVIRTRDGKRYVGSPKALMPLPLMHPMKQLRREADPILHELSAKLKQSVVLVLYVDTERIAIDIAQSPGSLAPFYSTWLTGPRHASGSGKALLLSLGSPAWQELLGPGPYTSYTPHTLTTPELLEKNLTEAAERGYLITRDEHHLGLTAVSANIATWQNHNLGCFVVTGHSHELDDMRIASVGEELMRTANLMRYQTTCMQAVAHYLDSTRHAPQTRHIHAAP